MRITTTVSGPQKNDLRDAPLTPQQLLKALGIDPTQERARRFIQSHGQALAQAFAKPGGPFTVKEAVDGPAIVQSRDHNIPLPAGFRELAWALARQYPDRALGLLVAAKPHAQSADARRDLRLASAWVITMPELFANDGYTAYALELAERYPDQILDLLDAVDPLALENTSDAQQLRHARTAVAQALKTSAATTTAMTTHTLTTAVTSTTTTLSGSGEPLHAAAQDGKPEVLRQLLEGGADVNQVDVNGQTALNLAAANGHDELVELLLEHKADVDWKGYAHKTPLLDACRGGHTAVARLLLKGGADVNAQTDVGDTALLCAASGQDPGLLTLLLLNGANVDHTNHQRRTALHLACQEGLVDNVRILLEAQASLRARDSHSRTAMDLALVQAQNHPERQPIVEMLKQAQKKATY